MKLPTKKTKLTLATRASALALAQATLVCDQLRKHWPEMRVEILKIKTSGDKIQDRPLRTVGGKGLFVKEIEEALIAGTADFAVHSMKDVPAEIPPGLKIGVILAREDPADVLISKNHLSLLQLPKKARVGTSSLRRKIQLLKIRPDLQIEDLRGNVETRIRKMKEGLYDAVILAFAGLRRLNLESEITEKLGLICAPGQGAIGIEYREEDPELENLLKKLHDEKTALCVGAERVILKNLEGGCEFPLGAEAKIIDKQFCLKAFVADPEGKIFLQEEGRGVLQYALTLAEEVSEKLLQKGAKSVLQKSGRS